MCCATAAQAGTIAASARTHSKKTAGTGAEGCIASQSPHSAAAKGDTGRGGYAALQLRCSGASANRPAEWADDSPGYGSDCRNRGLGRRWAQGAGS